MVTAAATDSDLLLSAGGRLGRDSVIYGIAIGMALPFGLAGVVVFTRYLTPSEYGSLALLLVGSALLTLLYSLPTLMGTMVLAYGASAGDDEADVDDQPQAGAGRSGVTLTTGLVLTLATAIPPTIVIVLLAPQIADLVAGPQLASAVRWAALSAAGGSVYRLVLNIPRIEHRPVLYAVLSTTRPAFGLTIGAIMVIGGSGAKGVVAGLALGTILATVLTLLVTAKSYAPRVSPGLLPAIWSRSWPTSPMIASTWTLQNVDLLVLSSFASNAAVGNYRVANRLAAFVLYGISAFLMAMGPVQQTSLFKAVHDATGQPRVSGLLVRYFAIGGIYIVLLVALSADALFLLAAPAYREATPLVTLIAAGFMAFGLARVLARTAPVRKRSRKGVRSMSVAAVCFVPLCFVLIPLGESVGAAASMLVAMLALCAWWIVLIARAEQRLDVGWRRVLTAAIVATACYGLSAATGSLADASRIAIDVLIALVVCPGLLVLTGAVPLRHVRPLGSVVATATMPQRRRDRELREQIERLDGSDLVQVKKGLVIRGSGNARCLARPSDLEQFVGVLRSLSHLGDEGREHDGQIGSHLVSGGTYAEIQARAQSLRERGVDPTELYRLEDVFRRAARMVRIG